MRAVDWAVGPAFCADSEQRHFSVSLAHSPAQPLTRAATCFINLYTSMEKKKYKKYQAARESNPAFTLNQIGKIAFNRAKVGERYQQLEIITAQLMCALTMEAVLNYLGKRLFKSKEEIERCLNKKRLKKLQENNVKLRHWEEVERVLTSKEKLKMIVKYSALKTNLTSPPFCYFPEIFKFRDNLAHAKSSQHFASQVKQSAIDENGFPMIDKISNLTTDWEKLCSVDTAEKWRNAVYRMSSILSNAANCQDPILIDGAIDTWAEIET